LATKENTAADKNLNSQLKIMTSNIEQVSIQTSNFALVICARISDERLFRIEMHTYVLAVVKSKLKESVYKYIATRKKEVYSRKAPI
jgi:hypothetical protein